MAARKKQFRKVLGRRARSFLRRAPAACSFILVGVLIGIGASEVWELPEKLGLLWDGVFGVSGQELVLRGPERAVTPASLTEFGALQRPPKITAAATVREFGARARGGSETPPTPPMPPTLPTVAAPSREASADLSPATDPPPDAEMAAERVIREIAARRDTARAADPRVGPVVQVAAYTDARSADALALRLRRKGFDSFVAEGGSDVAQRFRVRVQPTAEVTSKLLAQQLTELGFSVWVTRQ